MEPKFMRGIFGLISILVVLAVVSLIAKKQLSTQVVVPAASVEGTAAHTIKPAEITRQVLKELNNLSTDVAKRLDQVEEGKQ